MALILDPTESALRRGIKTVGVGKKGSKAMDAALAGEVLCALKSRESSPAAVGAFFAALAFKGAQEQEIIVEEFLGLGVLNNPKILLEKIDPQAPDSIKALCVDLLNGKTLSVKEAYQLGKFLFSDQPGDGVRGFVASFLRIRYETPEEYYGIWQAMQETITPAFKMPTPKGEPIIQLSEPFDGNDKSYIITPIVGHYLQGLGYRVVHMIGRNSGPKLVMNLLDIAQGLDVNFASSNSDLANVKPLYGWFIRQEDVSPALNRWVDIRHQTIKRPFLATLEKFIKPLDSDIMVSSAFHPPYGEKMTTISEMAGFKKVIVVRNGIEGSIAFPLKRAAKILLSVQDNSKVYQRREISFDDINTDIVATEEMRDQLTVQENIRLIQSYMNKGTSGDQWFDCRVKITCEGFKKILNNF